MKPRVLISVNVTPEQLAHLAAAAPGIELVCAPGGIAFHAPSQYDAMEPTYPAFHPDLDLDPLLATIDGVVAFDLPPDLPARAPNVRWVCLFHAGVDAFWQPYLADPAIDVTTVSGTHPLPMAEYVLSLLLYFAKRLGQFREQQAQHVWRKAVVAELHGAPVTIVGYGTIGAAVAQTLAQMGMRVSAVRRTPEPGGAVPAWLEAIYSPADLPRALADARYVVSILPSTPETQNYWTDAAFALLPPEAVFINIGRGRTVDEPALLRALDSGQLSGAGLDVFAVEPLPADSPLWDRPDVLVVPHTGSETINYTDRALAIVADNLARFAAGQPLRNVIDKQLRY